MVVSPEAGLARLRAELRDVGDVLTDLPWNPPPYSVQLRVAPALRTAEALRSLAAEPKGIPAIQDADYGEEAVARLAAIRGRCATRGSSEDIPDDVFHDSTGLARFFGQRP